MSERWFGPIKEFRTGSSVTKWLEKFDLLMEEYGATDDQSILLFLCSFGGKAITNKINDVYQSQLPPNCPYSEVKSKLIEVLEPQSQETLEEVDSEDETSGVFEEFIDLTSGLKSDEETDEEEESLKNLAGGWGLIRLKIDSDTVLKENELSSSIYFDRMLLKADAGPSFSKEIRMSGVVESLLGKVGSFRIVLEASNAKTTKINGRFLIAENSEVNKNRTPKATPRDILSQVAVSAVLAFLNEFLFAKTWFLLVRHEGAEPEPGITRAKLDGPQEENRRISTVTLLGKFLFRSKHTIESE